jgi:integrase
MVRRDDHGVRLEKAGDYWQARWYDTAGKRKGRGLGAVAKVSRAEARRRCREIERELAQNPGRRDAGKAPTLDEWLKRYAALRTDVDESTARRFGHTAEYLRRHFGKELRIDRITRAQAAGFRVWLEKQTYQRSEEAQARELSLSTVRGHMSRTKQAFGRALELDLLVFNPFDREKTSQPAMEHEWPYITDDQVEKAIDAAPSREWRLRLALARWAGLRRNEIGRAEWGWIDWSAKTITVVPKERGGKRLVSTKHRTRECPLSPRLYAMLLEAFNAATERSGAICGMPGNNVERDLESIVRRAEMAPWTKPLHSLRKSLETDWLARHPLLDVVKWLGNSPEVAAKHYHQSRPEVVEQVTQDGGSRIPSTSSG